MMRKGNWHSASVWETTGSGGDCGELMPSPKETTTANLHCGRSFQVSKNIQKSGFVHVQSFVMFKYWLLNPIWKHTQWLDVAYGWMATFGVTTEKNLKFKCTRDYAYAYKKSMY